MPRIDEHNPSIVRIGDNRHAPIRLISDNTSPYEQRTQRHKQTEMKILAPLQKLNRDSLTKRWLELKGRFRG